MAANPRDELLSLIDRWFMTINATTPDLVDDLLANPAVVLNALGLWKEGPVGHRGDHAVEHWIRKV